MQFYSRLADTIPSLSQISSPIFQNFPSELSVNQKRAAVITAVATAVFAVLYLVYRYVSNHQSVPAHFSSKPAPSYYASKPDRIVQDDVKNDKPLEHVWSKSDDPIGTLPAKPDVISGGSPSPVQPFIAKNFSYDPNSAFDKFKPSDYIFDDGDDSDDSDEFIAKAIKKISSQDPHLVPVNDPYPTKSPDPKSPVQSAASSPRQDDFPEVKDPVRVPAQTPARKPDPILDPLIAAEKQIQLIREDLYLANSLLTVYLNEVEDGKVEDSIVKDQHVQITELEDQLGKALLEYPQLLHDFLIDRFGSNSNRKNHQEIYHRVVNLAGFMDACHKNEKFVLEGLTQIDSFLQKTFFNSPNDTTIQEEKKVDLVVFHAFFGIADSHFQVATKMDPDLAHRLKVRLANLPLIDGKEYHKRTDFKKIYLDEAEQRRILIAHFQEEEDRAVQHAIHYFKTKTLTQKDVKKLSKLASAEKSSLSSNNLQVLQTALKAHLGSRSPQSWDHYSQVEDLLSQFFNLTSDPHGYNDPYGYYRPAFNSFDPSVHGIQSLYHAGNARRYFEEQTAIPRWYHTTDIGSVKLILESGKILVQHQQMYKGAWVSTQREPTIDRKGGDAVLIFSHAISDLDPDVTIGFEQGGLGKRWRGLNCEIPVIKSDGSQEPYLVLLGLGSKQKRSSSDKDEVIRHLRSKGIKHYHMLSLDGIDYIQKNIKKVIGNPNLTEKWWGKANVADLDKPIEPNH